MQKIISLFLALILSLSAFPGLAGAQPESASPPSAEGLGRFFSALAMAEFANENPGQDSSVLAVRAEEYGRQVARILLEAKVEPQEAQAIIEESAPWYAQALDNILNGSNSLNFYTNEYIRELTDLFSRCNLGLAPQSEIVLLASSHLQKMKSILKPSFYNYE